MIDLIITDFDGTLVDTFEANLKAYQMAFSEVGLVLERSQYIECFGDRFDRFMYRCGIHDEQVTNLIKEYKKKYYPFFFNHLHVNEPLVDLINTFHLLGGKTAVASTARKVNLYKVLDHIGLSKSFDLIISGDEVEEGKPSPEIYLKIMSQMEILPQNTLIFEDSNVGFEAATNSGAKVIRVNFINN